MIPALLAGLLVLFLVQVYFNTRLRAFRSDVVRLEKEIGAEERRKALLTAKLRTAYHPDQVFQRFGKDAYVRVNPEKIPVVTVVLNRQGTASVTSLDHPE